MSDGCECDNCGKRGCRLRGKLAPEGWLFLEHLTADADDGMTVVWACSKGCALALWKRGPGKLDLMDDSSAHRRDPDAKPAFVVDEDVLREVGMTLMLTELLGVSADAVRATALSPSSRIPQYLSPRAVSERVLTGRICLLASNGFPYAGGDVVDVSLNELEAVGLLSVWRSDRMQVLLRLKGEKLVLIRPDEQTPTMRQWLKETLKNVRARKPSKEQAWMVLWKELRS